MTMQAVCPSATWCLLFTKWDGPLYVRGLRDLLQMGWVDARWLTAKMVQDHAAEQLAFDKLVRIAMREYLPFGQSERAVAITIP
jgi:hypothetical protein